MSPDVISQSPPRRWFEHPLFTLALSAVLFPALISVGATFVTLAKTSVTDKIEALLQQQQATAARVDANKRERIEEFKELRRDVVTKEVLDEKWETVKKIDRTVDELLRLQLKERR
ncbi:MAG: hypothetical protein LC803_16690 [Acidobacteria bacterium]|nr:hypothetical protein [Acidobacteriota bacterium]